MAAYTFLETVALARSTIGLILQQRYQLTAPDARPRAYVFLSRKHRSLNGTGWNWKESSQAMMHDLLLQG